MIFIKYGRFSILLTLEIFQLVKRIHAIECFSGLSHLEDQSNSLTCTSGKEFITS